MKQSIIINEAGARRIKQGYPHVDRGWILEGGPFGSGDIVDVAGKNGKFLARGFYEKNSSCPVRVLTLNRDEIDQGFFAAKIKKAFSARDRFIDPAKTTVYRAFNEESDGISGLAVDIYGGYALIQLYSRGIEKFIGHVVSAIDDIMKPKGVYTHSRMTRSHLYPREPAMTHPTDLVSGKPARDTFTVKENGLNFQVSLLNGSKTGLYPDMRDNRALVSKYSRGARVLNTFSYTGSFSAYAMSGGAVKTVNIDLSRKANNWAKANYELNSISPDDHAFISGDVFGSIKRFKKKGDLFDLVIVDPSTFSRGEKSIYRAERDYSGLCASVFELIPENGYAACALNSHDLNEKWFYDALKKAAVLSKKKIEIREKGGQGPDFPADDLFPEGKYLKFAIVKISKKQIS